MYFLAGREIKAARILACMEQVELAAAAGVHRNSVSAWETACAIPEDEPHAVSAMRAALARAGVDVAKDPFGLHFNAAYPFADAKTKKTEAAAPADPVPVTTARAHAEPATVAMIAPDEPEALGVPAIEVEWTVQPEPIAEIAPETEPAELDLSDLEPAPVISADKLVDMLATLERMRNVSA